MDNDLEEGLVSGPFSESELRRKYPQVLLNSLGAGIKDLTRPYVRTLVEAAHGGVNRHIQLAMKPTRPCLAAAFRILNCINDPSAAQFDGCSPHRMVLTPTPEHGLVSTVGPNGLFYAHAIGAFGVVSAGRNWDRLASAAHRWTLKLVANNEFSRDYFLTTPWF